MTRAVTFMGPLAVCVYVAGAIIPVERDVSSLMLALLGLATVAYGVRNPRSAAMPLLLPVVALVLSLLLSTAVSKDVARSWELSAPLVPGLLLFVMLTEYCDLRRPAHAHAVYGTFSAVALVLASIVVYEASTRPGAAPATLITKMANPLLIVPNDTTFMAVVTPLSIALLLDARNRLVWTVACLSVGASVLAVCLLQSRVAALTMLGSVAGMAIVFGSRRAAAYGAAIITLAVIIDGATGFPLLAKFRAIWDPRLALWAAAIAMTRDAPVLGNGPHTFGLLYRSYLAHVSLPPWLPVDDRIVPWAHNLYLELLSEQGVVGLGALLSLLAAGVAAGWRLRRSPCRETRIAAAGACCALLAFSAAAIFELSLLRQWVVLVLFTFYGVVTQLSSNQARDLEVTS